MTASSRSVGADAGNTNRLAEYILQAELDVPASNSARFEALVGEFLDKGGFSRLHPAYDARLVLGLRTPEPRTFMGNSDADIKWRIRVDNRMSGDAAAFRYLNVF